MSGCILMFTHECVTFYKEESLPKPSVSPHTQCLPVSQHSNPFRDWRFVQGKAKWNHCFKAVNRVWWTFWQNVCVVFVPVFTLRALDQHLWTECQRMTQESEFSTQSSRQKTLISFESFSQTDVEILMCDFPFHLFLLKIFFIINHIKQCNFRAVHILQITLSHNIAYSFYNNAA